MRVPSLLLLTLLSIVSVALGQEAGLLDSGTSGLVSHTTDDLFILEDSHTPVRIEDVSPKPPQPSTAVKPPVDVDVTGKGSVQIFRLANEAYEKEQFEESIAYYFKIVERGVRNGDLFLNLANAFFRTGDFGRAILFYEKALKLRPRDMDIRHNRDYVRTFLIDKETKSDRLPGSLETLLILHRQTTLNETLWLLAFLSGVFVTLLILKVLRLAFTDRVLFGYMRGVVFVLLLLQTISAGFKIWFEEPIREGVVLTDSVKATASPSSGEQLLELNSGTKVRILDIRNGYAHIRLPDGVPAFVKEEQIGEV